MRTFLSLFLSSPKALVYFTYFSSSNIYNSAHIYCRICRHHLGHLSESANVQHVTSQLLEIMSILWAHNKALGLLIKRLHFRNIYRNFASEIGITKNLHTPVFVASLLKIGKLLSYTITTHMEVP